MDILLFNSLFKNAKNNNNNNNNKNKIIKKNHHQTLSVIQKEKNYGPFLWIGFNCIKTILI